MDSNNSISSIAWKLRWLIAVMAVIFFILGLLMVFRLFFGQQSGLPVEMKEQAKSMPSTGNRC